MAIVINTVTVYLNSAGDVLGKSGEGPGRTPMDLATYQATKDATATEAIAGAPKNLITVYHSKRNNYMFHRKIVGDGTQIGDYGLVTDLDLLKSDYTKEIDDECEARIHDGPGFEWPPTSGQFFSLSSNAQVKWNGMLMAKDIFDYVLDPPQVRTKDDQVEYTISDATEVENMWGTAMNVVRAYLNDCRAAKGDVLAASNKFEADTAYEDYIAS
jgi:hypothetical protein